MRSSVCYMGKNDQQLDLLRKSRSARFVHDFYEVGPWRIDFDHLKNIMAKNGEPFDFASEENIFHDYILPQNIDWEFQYYPARDHIFIIWRKNQLPGADAQPHWNAALDRLASILPQFANELKLVGALPVEVAQFNTIQEERKSLPEQMGDHGCCGPVSAKEFKDLYGNFNDRGTVGPSETRLFTVYELGRPFSRLPGLADNAQMTDSSKDTDTVALKARLLDADNWRCNLQTLPESILTDSTQGHWDLFWPDGKSADSQWYVAEELAEPLVGRDPAADIKKAAVTIDFGTTSTVVAMRDNRGQISLLRVGVQAAEMRKPITPAHFENPTVLSFEHLQPLLAGWRGVPYRPFISWKDVQCSHQARQELHLKVQSGMTGIKTWARGQRGNLVITDSDGDEMEIKLPPVEDDGSLVSEDLNPIELYAYFLGLHLNNQLVDAGRIFTEYYLTFPVKFDSASKSRILNGFRKGLLRSLPPSLIYASGWDEKNFVVEERSNEPAAFAAAVLPIIDLSRAVNISAAPSPANAEKESGGANKIFYTPDQFNELAARLQDGDIAIESIPYLQDPENGGMWLIFPEEIAKSLKQQGLIPERSAPAVGAAPAQNLNTAKKEMPLTDEGMAFGVFDFGGGTTDFAIGLYRKPTPAEMEENGWEKVLEILDTSGDEDLGGENLLEDLAFEVIRENRDKLVAENVVPFLRSLEKKHLPGSEELFGTGTIARANTKKLCEKLRPLWEAGQLNDADGQEGQISETFRDRDNKPVAMTLNVNEPLLRETLRRRISQGVNAFFATFTQACKQNNLRPDAFHIILAGNSCQSPLVMECFQNKAGTIPQNEDTNSWRGQILIHPTLLPDQSQPEGVTLKTGVAIGLLQTLDGESTGILSRNKNNAEAPFGWYVGPMHNNCMKTILHRNSPYGEWREFSKVHNHGKNKFLYSLSPLALEGEVARGENCLEETLDWGRENAGKTIAAAPVAPGKVCFALKDAEGKILENSEKILNLEF